jgi:hypothetical protein
MRSGASTPEELESLLEDAFVIGDHVALGRMFESGAVLVGGREGRQARGDREIARLAAELGDRGYRYLADSRRVLQARDTALVVAEQALAVMRRGEDRCWRYAISVLNDDDATGGPRP